MNYSSSISFDFVSNAKPIRLIIIPNIFKLLGISKYIKAPKIVAEIGSALLHKIVAFPLSILVNATLNKKYGNIDVNTEWRIAKNVCGPGFVTKNEPKVFQSVNGAKQIAIIKNV